MWGGRDEFQVIRVMIMADYAKLAPKKYASLPPEVQNMKFANFDGGNRQSLWTLEEFKKAEFSKHGNNIT